MGQLAGPFVGHSRCWVSADRVSLPSSLGGRGEQREAPRVKETKGQSGCFFPLTLSLPLCLLDSQTPCHWQPHGGGKKAGYFSHPPCPHAASAHGSPGSQRLGRAGPRVGHVQGLASTSRHVADPANPHRTCSVASPAPPRPACFTEWPFTPMADLEDAASHPPSNTTRRHADLQAPRPSSLRPTPAAGVQW